MAVTIKDVAEKVGVAPSTVSRVLNGKGEAWASAATTRRIHEVAREMGYLSNPHATALKSGRSPLVAFIVGSLDNQAEATKAWRLHSVVGDLGREVISTDVSGLHDFEHVAQVLHMLRPFAAVWLRPPVKEDDYGDLVRSLHDEDVYVLLVDCAEPPEDDLPCDALIVSRSRAAYIATRHLIELGHSRIGLIADRDSNRIPGYETALAEAGIDRRAFGFYPSRADARGGREAAQRLVSEEPEVTAVFCHSDLVAVGAMRGLNELGLQIPDDMAVVGFDNDPWTGFLQVPLTTLAHPVSQLCEHTSQCLAERMAGDDGPWQRIELKPRLIVRDSSGASHN